MIRGLFRLIFRLAALAVLVLICTAIYIVYDGLNDHGDHADCAVVPGGAVRRDGEPKPLLRERLDRAVELYRAGKFPLIIVSGATRLGGYDEPAAMSNYLVEQQVPVSAIIQDRGGAHTSETGEDVARIMQERGLSSVMIVTNYYHITRMKLALGRAGVKNLEQAHVGVVQKEDAFMLARETLAFYDYLFKFYLEPEAEKVRQEAQAEAQKAGVQAQIEAQQAKEEADQMRNKVNQDLQNEKK
jgi:vancomycin permeability regulator SanA